MKKSDIHTQANYFLSILIAFFLPVYIHVVPFLIALFTINWIAEGNFSEKFNLLKKNKIAWLFILFYFLHLVGMLWTDNFPAGWFDLQVKLSLLLFPIIVSTSKYKINSEYWEWSFVLGCILAGIICLTIATVHYIRTGEKHFEYTLLSYILHPAYLALYVNFSIAIIVFSIKNLNSKKEGIIKIIALIFLSVFVILLSSKVGTILLALIILAFIVAQIVFYKKWIFGISILFASALIFFVASRLLPSTIDRIHAGIQAFTHVQELLHNPVTMESNLERILIWESSLRVVKKNTLFGTGTGDVKDELIKIYREQGYTYLAEHQLNAHSQFLQSTIALGILGGIALLLCLFIPLYFAIRKRNFIYLVFLLAVIMNFSVESMLETQAGVMFYSFFNSLFLFSDKEKA